MDSYANPFCACPCSVRTEPLRDNYFPMYMIYPENSSPLWRVFLCFLVLTVAATGCNRTSKKEETAATKAEQAKNIAEKEQADSVIVDRELQREPAFSTHSKLVRQFYSERGYRLAWFKGEKLIPQAEKFAEVINQSHRDGLDPNDYKLKNFDALYKAYQQEKSDPQARLEKKTALDVALTASYFKYSTDFYKGMVDPKGVEGSGWNVKGNSFKPGKALQTILGERESRYPYYQFEPLHEEYERLRTALAKYREIKSKGGWPQVTGLTKLQPGDTSATVPLLRQRLLGRQDPTPGTTVTPLPVAAKSKSKAKSASAPASPAAPAVPSNPRIAYDDELVAAVKEFQSLHGLRADGVIGKQTIETINVPVEDRIEQIMLNMERWRWVPKKLPERHVLVNIPEYHLYVKEAGKTVLDMKVIVGKTMNSTPIFSDRIEYIVFSPFWNVTKNILLDEVVPNQLKNPNFLDSQDMEVVKDLGKDKVEVIPTASVDWALVDENWPYRVRQRPGKINPLGFVKFIFPNAYDVYLHDTPADHLFNQVDRGFSHGCIRIEKPEQMTEYLLDTKPEWTPERIKKAMHAGREEYVNVGKKVPVYIVYFTSWVDDQGKVHFRNDVYGHDKALAEAFFANS